jgi:hypothetical protein
MAMILTIDTLATRYGMLPSEALLRGSTFDLYVMDAAVSYHNYQQKKASNNGVETAPELSTEEMLEIMKKARSN